MTAPCGNDHSSEAYCFTDISLVPAAHVVTQPEIRLVNSVVQKHPVSTFRADWLLFQVVLSFLIRDCASRGASEPIYGLHDGHELRSIHINLRTAEIGTQVADLAITQPIQTITR